MNKYQEALDELKDFSSRGFGSLIQSSGSFKDVEDYEKVLDTLQELIEESKRETVEALKDEYTGYKCSACGSYEVSRIDLFGNTIKHKFCPDCGRKLIFKE